MTLEQFKRLTFFEVSCISKALFEESKQRLFELERHVNVAIRYNGMVNVKKYEELFEREKKKIEFSEEDLKFWDMVSNLEN